MTTEILVLAGTAATIGFIHTILGPDHYLPFVVLSKSSARTFWVTLACGVGHVLGSVVLGLVGIALGVALFRLEAIESVRGDVAAWLLMAFGFTYFVWGLRRALRSRTHEHRHNHPGGLAHSHPHGHTDEHSHPHETEGAGSRPGCSSWCSFSGRASR